MVINNKQEECHMRFRFIHPGEMKLAFPRGKVIYYPMRQVENNMHCSESMRLHLDGPFNIWR